jgi:hypothetical protein
MGPLHDYEFSRESGPIHEQVNFIRYRHLPAPNYWSPNREFGWPEWPEHSYLSIPREERLARLQKLAGTNYDEIRALSVRPPVQGPPPSGRVIPVYLDADLSPQEQSEAVLALLRVETRSGGYAKASSRRAQGRASTAARRFDRVRALSAARLLQLYPAKEALKMMNEAHRKPELVFRDVFSNVSTLRRAANRTYPYLVEFMLLAASQIARGLWPPPFGPTPVDL